MGLAKKSKLKRTKYERKRVARKRQDRHAASPVSDSEHRNNRYTDIIGDTLIYDFLCYAKEVPVSLARHEGRQCSCPDEVGIS